MPSLGRRGARTDLGPGYHKVWTVDAVRAVLVAVLALVVLAGWATIALLAAIGFLLGTGQTLIDNAAQSLIPALVGRDRHRLERANSQLYGARTVGQHFVGPPAGGLLFSLASWVLFAQEQLGLGSVGYGLLLAAHGAGRSFLIA